MMFRGSPGGNFNANTREGLTQYLFTVPAEDLEVALHIEATRMRAVLDTQKDWDQERGAIEQEVAQDLSEPGYVLYSKIRAAMFAGTPYAHDALGTQPSFDRTTAAGLLARSDLGLPLDEPTAAARAYIDLSAADVQAAFRKWMRPDDLVRVSEGPTPR